MCILSSYSLMKPELNEWGMGYIQLLLVPEHMPLCSKQPVQLYSGDLDILPGATVAPVSQDGRIGYGSPIITRWFCNSQHPD